MSKPKVRLSLDRFLSFLETHKYVLASLYCEGDNIRFAECRTPRQQKTFMIHVPKKYLLPGANAKMTSIYVEKSGLGSRQIKYLSDLRGPLLECDLLAISSSNICMYKNSGQALLYGFGKPKTDSKSSDTDFEEGHPDVSHLEKDTDKVLDKVQPGYRLPKPKVRNSKDPVKDSEDSAEDPVENSKEDPEDSTGDSKEDSTEDSTEDSKEESTEGTDDEGEVELVFQDSEGGSIEDVKEFIAPDKSLERNLQSVTERIKLASSSTSEETIPDFTTHDNTLPPNIKYSDIVLGIVYPMIDLGSFYRKVKGYEKEVISICEQINDNILDIRNDKLKEIRDGSSIFLTHAENRLKKINEQEKSLRSALIRLTIILSQTEILRKKVDSNPKVLKNEMPEIERIFAQTRKTIHELNIDLLRLQDSADELLSNYQSSIKEMMDL